jgi:non-specific serine/threonine protein kinase
LTTPYHSKALPEGAILREWRLEQVLGVGGFGIVYRGKGVYFDELVAIKEYFPGAISDRTDGTTVTPTDSSSEEIYALGLQKFLEEAKVLWNLSKPERHPNIVSVRSLFEIHGTAYMVMDFETGVSLSQLLKRGHTFDEASLLAVIRPIAEGLDRAHRAGVLHRDIKPANILVDDTGRPVLIDFGSARFESGQATSTKVTFYTPPYAALEQYVKTYPQGPWTDIYALGVTLYQCVTGEKPPEVLERLHGGLGEALSARERPGFSRAFTRAVDAAMAPRPQDRPQTIADWLKMFDAPDVTAEDDEATRIAVAPPAAVAAAAAVAPVVVPVMASVPAPPPAAPIAPVPQAVAATGTPALAGLGEMWGDPGRRKMLLIAGGGAAAVVVLIGVAAAAVLVLKPGAGAHAPAATPVVASAKVSSGPSASANAASWAILQNADGLVADARAANRPAAEIASLTDANTKLAALAGHPSASGPADLNTQANDMARAEAAALGRASDSQWREVDRTLGHASGGEGAGALAKVRGARAALTTATQAVTNAPDGAAALAAARTAVAAFPAFTSAYGEAARAFGPAKRAEITAVASSARATAAQVIALAAGPRPWLFAPQARKQAYQKLQDNAARAKSELTSLEAIARSASASNDVRTLEGSMSQLSAVKRDLAGLYASSRAAAAASAGSGNDAK